MPACQRPAHRSPANTLPDQPTVQPAASAAAQRLRQVRALAADRRVNPLLWAVLVQGLLLLATAWILVFRAQPEEVLFLPVNTAQVTAQALPQQTLMAQMARSSGAAALHSLAQAQTTLPLPEAIATDTSAATQFATAASAFSPLNSGTTAYTGFGSGADPAGADIGQAIGDALSPLQPVSFFGIEERAERYVILLDTSDSMFVRSRDGKRYSYDFGQVKEETARLLQSFNANTLFNIIVYEGGAWAWQPDLQAATRPVREQAQGWVRGIGENPRLSIRDRRGQGPLLREGGGTRLDTALKLAFSEYAPEVIFIVTDGEINMSPGGRITEETLISQIRSLQAQQPLPARIHVVHFKTAQMREVELQTLRAIAREGKGRFTEIVATER